MDSILDSFSSFQLWQQAKTWTRSSVGARNNTGEPTAAAGRPLRQLSITKCCIGLHWPYIGELRLFSGGQHKFFGLAFSYSSSQDCMVLLTFYHALLTIILVLPLPPPSPSQARWQIKCVRLPAQERCWCNASQPLLWSCSPRTFCSATCSMQHFQALGNTKLLQRSANCQCGLSCVVPSPNTAPSPSLGLLPQLKA